MPAFHGLFRVNADRLCPHAHVWSAHGRRTYSQLVASSSHAACFISNGSLFPPTLTSPFTFKTTPTPMLTSVDRLQTAPRTGPLSYLYASQLLTIPMHCQLCTGQLCHLACSKAASSSECVPHITWSPAGPDPGCRVRPNA